MDQDKYDEYLEAVAEQLIEEVCKPKGTLRCQIDSFYYNPTKGSYHGTYLIPNDKGKLWYPNGLAPEVAFDVAERVRDILGISE